MLRLAVVVLLVSSLGARAHEFWIEPEVYRVAEGETIAARTYNGEYFDGIEYGYSEDAYQQSGVAAGDLRGGASGERGARPAFQVPPAGPGLNVLYHASPVSTLTYPGMEKFEKFLRGKRLEAALEVHAAKGLPTEKIREAYFRFVKALVAVGDGAGADVAVGMPYELVALTNPYTEDGDMQIEVRLQGALVGPGAPVFVFHRQGEEVTRLALETDAEGRFTVPALPGDYMANAVHIMEAGEGLAERTGAHWVTLWAALNYRIEG